MLNETKHALWNAYPYRTELHTHTKPISTCSDVTVAETVAAYAAKGCHSLTITNHLKASNYDPARPAEEAERFLSDYYEACRQAEGKDMNILLGAELRFEDTNDYLLYGICPEDIERIITLMPLGLGGFYKEFHNDRNLLLQAHPFRKGLTRAPLEYLDGIEVFNFHQDHNSKLGFSKLYANEHDLIICGGSDFHSLGQEALLLLRTKNRLRDSYDVADALRSRDILFELAGSLILPY